MKFNINLTNLKELKQQIDSIIKICENLNNQSSREKEILKEMNLSDKQMNLLIELLEE